MRKDSTLYYLLADHLGSTALVTDANGTVVSEMRYTAWGETRYVSGSMPTKYTYTGQYSYTGDFGLHFYNARWYDSSLGRFAQADTIVTDGSQGLDRYAYTLNNPINYTDPSGHVPVDCYGTNYCGTSNSNLFSNGTRATYGNGLIGPALPPDWKPIAPNPFPAVDTSNFTPIPIIDVNNIQPINHSDSPNLSSDIVTIGLNNTVILGYRNVLNYSEIKWGNLFFDGVGLVGDLAGIFPVGKGVQKASNIIEGVGVANNAFSLLVDKDPSGVTLDLIFYIAKVSNAEKLIPFVGAGSNVYSISANINDAIIEIAIVRPTIIPIGNPPQPPTIPGPIFFENYLNP